MVRNGYAMSTWKPKPQVNTSAPNYVIDQIRNALIKRELNPGDKLPSETELTEMFGVSRGSIRQAMKALETMGVLSIRPGDGTYVSTSISSTSFNPLIFSLLISKASAKNFADARYALERDIYELVLGDEKGLSDLLPKLEENINRHKELLRENVSPEELAENDRQFHLLISQSCGNILIEMVYNFVMDAFASYIVETTASQSEEETNKTIRDHTLIYEALKAGDFHQAKEAANSSAKTWYELLKQNEK